MKGKTLTLSGLLFSLILLSGCGYFGWGVDEPTPEEQQPVVAEAPAPEPEVAPEPAKPLTAKERKQQAALEKKKAEEARKQAERDRKAGKKDPADLVQERLDTFAKGHLLRANATLRPNKANKAVRREGNQYCVYYSEVDLVTLKTELHPSNAPGAQYIGHVVYIENVIASYGPTEQAAKNGVFKQIKSKRIRELTRYDAGKWHY